MEHGEFTYIDEETWEPPSYSEKSSVLVNVIPHEDGYKSPYKFSYEVLEVTEGSAFWIQEGVDWDYWLDKYGDFPAEGGFFVIEGIHGSLHRYDGFEGVEYDEDWDYDLIRKATDAEVSSETLDSDNSSAL